MTQRLKVVLVPTDEEIVIARDTQELVKRLEEVIKIIIGVIGNFMYS